MDIWVSNAGGKEVGIDLDEVQYFIRTIDGLRVYIKNGGSLLIKDKTAIKEFITAYKKKAERQRIRLRNWGNLKR